MLVKADSAVQPGKWYSVSCTREQDKVTLALRPLANPDAPVATWTGHGPIGAVDFPAGAGHLSVGGKLGSSGEVVLGATDQFNGQVDNVVYDAW